MDTGGIEGPSPICRVVHHLDRKLKRIQIAQKVAKSGHFLGKSKFQIPKIVVIFRGKFGRDSRKAEIEITAV